MADGGTKNVWVIIGIVAAVLVLLCCGGAALFGFLGLSSVQKFQDMSQQEREAMMRGMADSAVGGRDAVAEDFLVALRDGGVDAAWPYTAPGFRQVASKEQFANVQRGIENVMGAYRSKRIKTFNVNERFGTGATGTMLALTYDATFENGEGVITFKLHEQPNGDFQVHQYQVNSLLFVEKLAGPDEPLSEHLSRVVPEERAAILQQQAQSALGGRAAVGEDFLVALRDEGVDAALVYTSPQFLMSKDQLAELQRGVEDAIGKYESKSRLGTLNISRRFGSGITGTVMTMTYDALFERGEGSITLSLHEQPDGSFLVLEYDVDSPHFPEAPDDE